MLSKPRPPVGRADIDSRRAASRYDSVVTFVLAGGAGTRLHELTANTCKPALPFAGSHRIVDWTLANVARSRLSRVVVATQYKPHSLVDHLRTRWQSVFFAGGRMAVVHGPGQCGTPDGFRGTADAVAQSVASLVRLRGQEVMVLGADHIYEMDYRPMLDAHRASGAKATVAVHRVSREEAPGYGIVAADTSGRATGFVEKPATAADLPCGPADDPLASMGIYVFDREWLAEVLAADAADPNSQHDFGRDILPRALADGGLYVYRAAATKPSAPFYWRDVGTLDTYRLTHLDLAAPKPPCALPDAPDDAWLCMRWHFADKNGNALMPGASIAAGATVRNAILGPGLRIHSTDSIGCDPQEDARWFRVTEGGTTLVTAEMIERRESARPIVHASAALPEGRERLRA